MQRINWIDWAKALAVTTVVFCHLPQSQEWFYYRYLQATIIVIFFWISGYLKKDRGSTKENWKKYWQGLILPYILWNVIVYPYWFIKYYILNGSLPDIMSALKPVFGVILLQHENAFCEPLNGPLWYIPAILILHIIADICHKSKFEHAIWGVLILLSIILYAANKYWYFAPNLTPMGLMRNLPYYYMGYLFSQYHLFKRTNYKSDFICCITCLSGSIILFVWHLHALYSGLYILHIVLFYPVNIGFLFGVLYLCKLFNNYKTNIIVNISIGTMVIIGLHIVLVSIMNSFFEQLCHFNNKISYHWYTALPVALLIVSTLYPIIIYAIRRRPLLIGRQ